MKDKKIKSIKCHVGIHMFAGDLTLGVEKHKCSFTLLPMGIQVVSAKANVIVPYTNITHIELEKDSE